MTPEEKAELIAVLESVGNGVTAKYKNPDHDWNWVFAGNVIWSLSNGWTVVVFNDCDSWDYVDSMTAPDGRSWRFDELYHCVPYPVSDWVPKNPEAWGLTKEQIG